MNSQQDAISTSALLSRLAAMEERLAAVEDREAIERLQYQYGYYIDNRMWAELAALFCSDGAEMEIGRRGCYRGRDRIHRFLQDVLGDGRWGLLKDEIINHIQLQPVITLAADRQTAKVRSRAIVQGNSPPGSGFFLWAEGLYENEYVKEDGQWRLRRLWWVPTFYTRMAGFDQAAFQTAPPSETFPPDAPSRPQDPVLGRSFVPFHYVHPFTGARVPSPTGHLPD